MPKDKPSVGRHFFSAVLQTLNSLRIVISKRVGDALIGASAPKVYLDGAVRRLTGFVFLSASAFLLVTTLLSSSFFLLPSIVAHAQTPNTTINYQARILNFDGSLVADGDYHVEFKIYTAQTATGTPDQGACTRNGGTAEPTCLWVETRSTGNLVRVVNGYVNANLGSVTAFSSTIPWSNDLYVTMRVGGKAGSPTWDTEMTNFTTGYRMKITAVPFAFQAGNVSSGSTNAVSTNSNNIVVQTGNALGTTSNSGNISIDSGTATATAGSINIGSANASALTIGRSGITTTLQGSVALTGAGAALTVTNDAVFNGNTTIGNASADTLTVNANANFTGNLSITSGDTFTNAGSSVYTAQAVSNLPTGGVIGTAVGTVDGATTFNITQTTASQALTLPSPTTTTAGRIVYVNNVGSASFTMYGTTIASNGSNAFIWNGSQWITTVSLSGSSVSVVGTIDSQTKSADGAVISGNAIYFQTADATNVGLVSTGTQTLAGAKTFNALLTVQAGLTATGAVVSLNDSSNFNTTINTGTSTGSVTIGNASNAANTVTVVAGATNGINLNAPRLVTNASTLSLFDTTQLLLQHFRSVLVSPSAQQPVP